MRFLDTRIKPRARYFTVLAERARVFVSENIDKLRRSLDTWPLPTFHSCSKQLVTIGHRVATCRRQGPAPCAPIAPSLSDAKPDAGAHEFKRRGSRSSRPASHRRNASTARIHPLLIRSCSASRDARAQQPDRDRRLDRERACWDGSYLDWSGIEMFSFGGGEPQRAVEGHAGICDFCRAPDQRDDGADARDGVRRSATASRTCSTARAIRFHCSRAEPAGPNREVVQGRRSSSSSRIRTPRVSRASRRPSISTT